MKTLKSFRLSEKAVQILEQQGNATSYIEGLILDTPNSISYGESLILEKLESLEKKLGATPTIDDLPPAKVEPELPEPMKMACCLANTPCRHWMWNGEEQAYINSLTGEVREA